jgi:Molybdopterin oxidoreductase Fe4S4 domain
MTNIGEGPEFVPKTGGKTRGGMTSRRFVPSFLRQLGGDPLGLGCAAQSVRSERLTARTHTADKVVQSICPYCAVGCGQKVYVKDEKVIQIEGDPDSPISRGRLYPVDTRRDLPSIYAAGAAALALGAGLLAAVLTGGSE